MPWSPLIAGPSQHYNMRTCGSVCSFNMKSHIRSCHTCAKLLQLCLSLCDPMDCNPAGSSVNGILQERILDWTAIYSSRESSQQGSNVSLLRFLHWEVGSLPLAPLGKPTFANKLRSWHPVPICHGK